MLARVRGVLPFADADVADTLQQFIEVGGYARPRWVLEPLVVEHEALHDVFPQPLCGPNAELRASLRLHPVADGENGIQVVVLRFIGFPVGGSYPEFPEN